MKQITQDRFYRDPTPESRGNCQQAATASILGLELEDVPNFIEAPEGFWESFDQFVESRGFYGWLMEPQYAPDGLYLAYGPSARGVSHACVYRDGHLEWDPHPSRAGLLKVTSVHVLVPHDPSEFVRTA
jgi:hypothetical protein